MSQPTNSDGVSCVREEAPVTEVSRRLPRLTSLFVAVGFAALAIVSIALAGEYHSNPWLLSWIPATCRVTNDCCWQVTESELKATALATRGATAGTARTAGAAG